MILLQALKAKKEGKGEDWGKVGRKHNSLFRIVPGKYTKSVLFLLIEIEKEFHFIYSTHLYYLSKCKVFPK